MKFLQHRTLVVAIAAALVWAAGGAGEALRGQIRIDIVPSGRATRLAVAPFVPRTPAGGPEVDSLLGVFNQVLWDDLKFSAFFELPSRSFYPAPLPVVPSQLRLDEWKAPQVEAEFIVFGNASLAGSALTIEAYLHDVKVGNSVFSRQYRSDRTAARTLAHTLADQVVELLSAGASKGVASTRLVYEGRRSGSSKEIHIADYDGYGARALTSNGQINMTPALSPDNRYVAFTSFITGKPEIFQQSLGDGSRRSVSSEGTFNTTPAYSRDGRSIAYSSRSAQGDPDIFLEPFGGGARRNLTNSRGADLSPAWSPTGRQIAFVSDRAGNPQIYIMDSDGSNVRRAFSEGGHGVSPDWSPDGRYLAFSWRPPGRFSFDLYMLEISSGQILQMTSASGTNENPSWSPDGRHIAFQSNRSGAMQIYVMNINGGNLRQVTSTGNNSNPFWSGYGVVSGAN